MCGVHKHVRTKHELNIQHDKYGQTYRVSSHHLSVLRSLIAGLDDVDRALRVHLQLEKVADAITDEEVEAKAGIQPALHCHLERMAEHAGQHAVQLGLDGSLRDRLGVGQHAHAGAADMAQRKLGQLQRGLRSFLVHGQDLLRLAGHRRGLRVGAVAEDLRRQRGVHERVRRPHEAVVERHNT